MRKLATLATALRAAGTLFVAGIAGRALAYSPPYPGSMGIAVPTSQVDDIGDFYNIVCVVTQWVMVFGLILGTLFVIWGGVKYITSGGDSGKAEDGKEVILTALIGIVFLILAVALVRLVATFFGSSSFNTFSLVNCR